MGTWGKGKEGRGRKEERRISRLGNPKTRFSLEVTTAGISIVMEGPPQSPGGGRRQRRRRRTDLLLLLLVVVAAAAAASSFVGQADAAPKEKEEETGKMRLDYVWFLARTVFEEKSTWGGDVCRSSSVDLETILT